MYVRVHAHMQARVCTWAHTHTHNVDQTSPDKVALHSGISYILFHLPTYSLLVEICFPTTPSSG